jgi:Cu2+-exporting ATPase
VKDTGKKGTASTLTLQAEGIMCTGCVTDMENILKDSEGIIDASVDYATGMINIRYDPEAVDEKQVFLKVSKLGFKTRIVR